MPWHVRSKTTLAEFILLVQDIAGATSFHITSFSEWLRLESLIKKKKIK